MTKKEISKIFDIPFSTVSDWQKENSSRHKLYEFLHAISKKEYQSIRSQQKNHRLLHILNRNIDKKNTYKVKDIKAAFSKTDFKDASVSQQVIYSKFFKECDSDDLKSLVELFCKPNCVIDFSEFETQRLSLLKSTTESQPMFPFQYSLIEVLGVPPPIIFTTFPKVVFTQPFGMLLFSLIL